jgi:hypothetical protein
MKPLIRLSALAFAALIISGASSFAPGTSSKHARRRRSLDNNNSTELKLSLSLSLLPLTGSGGAVPIPTPLLLILYAAAFAACVRIGAALAVRGQPRLPRMNGKVVGSEV